MAFTDHKISAFAHKITDLADQPNMPSDELKARFDSSPEELRQSVNALCDEGEALSARIDSYRAQTFTGEIERDMLAPAVQEELSGKADETSVAERILTETTAREDADAAETAAREALAATVAQKCQIASGRYTGNGVSGYGNSRSIEIGFAAKFVIFLRSDSNATFSGYFIRPSVTGMSRFDSNYVVSVTWSDTGVSWSSGNGAENMLNANGVTYYWIALG